MASSLLKFQIGPVQDFIAQARSTRDLWSGSYLLSWLVAEGIRELRAAGGKLIFPCDADACQPLLELPSAINHADHKAILTPNLPNIFIARVEGDAADVANRVADAIHAEWRRIAETVWGKRGRFGLSDENGARFFAQVDRHVSISWMATPVTGDGADAYKAAYRLNGWHLDAVRQVREFEAWDSAVSEHARICEKDSLSGKEEAVFRGTGNADPKNLVDNLLHRHADWLGAVAFIKRIWHIAYLKEEQHLNTGSREFLIRSIPAIAAREAKLDDEEAAQEKTAGDKYIAAIAFDGDSIGQWVNGDFLPEDSSLEAHHRDFSRALSRFALGRVRDIVEGTSEEVTSHQWKGQLIYAGGDDVVCLVPADIALEVAAELRDEFHISTKGTPATDGQPDASAGIAIAHIHAPLQDLIREAKKAEKRAKNTVGRPAFSITVMKRSGEISQWGSRWSSGGLELYRAITGLMKSEVLGARFPHRVCQLLTPYLTNTTGLARQSDAITDRATAHDLIRREFAHAAERQGTADAARQLDTLLTTYLDRLDGDTQQAIHAVIGLCTTLAFARRTAPGFSGNSSAP